MTYKNELSRFWQLVREGLTTNTPQQYRWEMESIVERTKSIPLRIRARREMHRYDEAMPVQRVAAR